MEKTEQHPITPPPELVDKWYFESKDLKEKILYISTQAARWGADQELQACCEWLDDASLHLDGGYLRADRRPKLPSLKERALSETAAAVAGGNITPERGAIIRLALEALPND